MKPATQTLLLIAVAGVAAAGGYELATHRHAVAAAETAPATTEPTEEEKPVVPVTTMSLARRTLAERIVAYGTVAAQASDVRSISVPFESRVIRVLVTAGARVEAGAEIVKVEASPDAALAVLEARNAVAVAEAEAKRVQQRFDEQLATNTELATAKQTSDAAALRLKSFTDRGVDAPRTLTAEEAGIVAKIDVQEGQIVAAGAPLIEVAAGDRIEARLGVEPDDAQALKPGQAVTLRAIGRARGDAIQATIRTVGQRVDPSTRLVEVLVALPADAPLLIETFVAGEIEKASTTGLIVPRDAALPDEDGKAVVFTAKDGKAVKHAVTLGLQTASDVEVIADDLHEGDAVIVVGNASLEDGMAVEAEASPTTEPTAEPSTKAADAPEAKAAPEAKS